MWNSLQKPIFVLAPMADVTDPAFRKIIAKYGKPDVMWTEFVSADGLFLGGKDALMIDLKYEEAQRPIVAQFFSNKPELMEKAAALAVELGFDGIDINMGCPDRSVEKQGSGAALIKNPKLAQEIIEATKRGAGNIPVSVKTRIGYSKNELEHWLPALLETKPAVVTIHARTRKELSKVPARWEHVKESVDIRDDLGSETLIFGNGDVLSLAEAEQKVAEMGCDGVMIGKGIFGNPWLFANSTCAKHNIRIERPSKLLAKTDCDCLDIETILKVMLEHTKTFTEELPDKNFAIMKKHYKAYVNGFDGAKELRMKLMETNTYEQVEQITRAFIDTL